MFGLGAKKPKREASRFPEGRTGFAVGDIHGRADLLANLLTLLETEADEALSAGGIAPIVVFLGDYVDRGPDSRGVIDLLLERPRACERRFLMGNHEQAMLGFLEDPAAFRGWLLHGGRDTLASYGVRPPEPSAPIAQLNEAADGLRARLPPTHRAFLSGLERFVQLGDYVFAHAGVDPERPLEDQTDDDLLWIRSKFIDSERALPFTVVHGHTVVDAPYRDARRIAIDTGAYATGKLTAARFRGADVEFFAAPARIAPRGT